MTLIFLVFLSGALTIVSPCILPVLPFVFARAERPFLRNGLPMLAGMALTRLYQLIRQSGEVHEREFSIEFLNEDVSVYAFTFG